VDLLLLFLCSALLQIVVSSADRYVIAAGHSMRETIVAVAAVIAAMGFGGGVGALVKHWLDSRRSAGEKEHRAGVFPSDAPK
jgi:hypothetical protein